MPLDGDILGTAINNIESDYNEVDIADIDAARLECNKRVAWAIIDHFKTHAELHIPGTGLFAPSGGGAVTGESVTGEIE